jgi:hypothetical protein
VVLAWRHFCRDQPCELYSVEVTKINKNLNVSNVPNEQHEDNKWRLFIRSVGRFVCFSMAVISEHYTLNESI